MRAKTFRWVATATLIVCALVGGYMLVRSMHGTKEGPLGKYLSNSTSYYAVGNPDKTGEPVLFGGFTFQNTTNYDMKILTIKPTNIPTGIKVLRTAILSLPPAFGAGTSKWVQQNLNLHEKSIPFTISSGKGYWQPMIEILPRAAGNFNVDGLLITYVWRNRTYHAYMPDQFIVCSNNPEPGTCNIDDFPSSPKTWVSSK